MKSYQASQTLFFSGGGPQTYQQAPSVHACPSFCLKKQTRGAYARVSL